MSNTTINDEEQINKGRMFKYVEKRKNSKPIKSMNPCNVLVALDNEEEDFNAEARTWSIHQNNEA